MFSFHHAVFFFIEVLALLLHLDLRNHVELSILLDLVREIIGFTLFHLLFWTWLNGGTLHHYVWSPFLNSGLTRLHRRWNRVSPLIVLISEILVICGRFCDTIISLLNPLFHGLNDLRDDHSFEVCGVVIILLDVLSAEDQFEPVFDLRLSSSVD